MPALPLTPEQLADAARLKALYKEWKSSRRAAGESASQEIVAALLGFSSQSSVSQYVNGKIPLNVNALVKFSQLFSCAPEAISPELAKEIQRIAKTSGNTAPGQEIDLESAPNAIQVRKVIFKISAGIAGFSVEYLDNGEGTPLFFSRAWAEKRGIKPEAVYATRVSGDSMAPGLRDSDIVVVNTADTKRQKEAVYAFNHDGEFTVKRLRYEMRRWWLVSDNPDQKRYPPMECGDGTYILGRVVLTQSESL